MAPPCSVCADLGRRARQGKVVCRDGVVLWGEGAPGHGGDGRDRGCSPVLADDAPPSALAVPAATGVSGRYCCGGSVSRWYCCGSNISCCGLQQRLLLSQRRWHLLLLWRRQHIPLVLLHEQHLLLQGLAMAYPIAVVVPVAPAAATATTLSPAGAAAGAASSAAS